MKEIMKKLFLASVLVLTAVSASAQMYGQVGVTFVKYEPTVLGVKLSSSSNAIRGVLGYEVNENLALEGLAAVGMGDSDFEVAGVKIPGAKFKVDSVVGLYAKPKFKFSPELEGFVRAGFARSQGTVSAGGLSESSSESGFSYGVGASYALSQKTSLNFDYMSYLNKNESQATGFTFGIGYKF
ncbi:MAG: outer membrane beta-barrel protein [Rhodoferax sp.]|nr:outer membrane beta-barrel protein [Rhodoferax sp.]